MTDMILTHPSRADDLRAVKTMTIGGREVTVRELTVAEIRAWLKDLEGGPGEDLLDLALIEETRLSDLARMTDIAPADLEALTPRELRQVLVAAREVNADFFGLRDRLLRLGRSAMEQGAAA